MYICFILSSFVTRTAVSVLYTVSFGHSTFVRMAFGRDGSPPPACHPRRRGGREPVHLRPSKKLLVLANVTCDPMEGLLGKTDLAGSSLGLRLLRPGLSACTCRFSEGVFLKGNPRRNASFVPLLQDGVDLYDLLFNRFRKTPSTCPHVSGRFSLAAFSNRTPLDDFVAAEMQSVIDRGYVVKKADIKGPAGPA